MFRSFHQSCRKCVPSYARDGSKQKEGNGYIMLTLPALTFCLGTWQVFRRGWKLDLIKNLEERTTAPVIPLPEDLSELADLEFRRVSVRGVFDHSREILVSPRSPIQSDEDRSGSLVTTQSKTGACVITPLKLSDRDATILVNRGWVPRDMQDQRRRQQGQVTGEVELVGYVRHSEKKPSFGMPNEPEKNAWGYRDIDMMSRALGTDACYIDADSKSTVPWGPLGGQTRVQLYNEHATYIATWYGLTAIGLYMWYHRFKKIPLPR